MQIYDYYETNVGMCAMTTINALKYIISLWKLWYLLHMH